MQIKETQMLKYNIRRSFSAWMDALLHDILSSGEDLCGDSALPSFNAPEV